MPNRKPFARLRDTPMPRAHPRDAVGVTTWSSDCKNRQFGDILFDRPLGEGKVDQILGPPPATIEPALVGRGSGRTPMRSGFSRAAGFGWPASTESA